jgi:hypothetical protein
VRLQGRVESLDRRAVRASCARSAGSSWRRRCSRTPLATEAQYLLARGAFETLGRRRYE